MRHQRSVSIGDELTSFAELLSEKVGRVYNTHVVKYIFIEVKPVLFLIFLYII